MNSKSSPSPIQKVLDLAKIRQFDQVKQASAENEYAKLREATDFVNNKNNEKFLHFKRLTKDTKQTAFKPNMVASSKNLYTFLQRFGGEIGQEKVWSNYMLMLKCYEFRNKNQTEQGARKTQEIKHEVVFCQNIEKTTAKSSGDVDQELQKMALERKELTMQQEIDRLQEQLRIRDLEVEGLKARLCQVESTSFSNPNTADLSEENRPIIVGERLQNDPPGLL